MTGKHAQEDLPGPPAGAYDEVWLVGDAGDAFPVGVLAPDGEGVWGLPAGVRAGRAWRPG